MGQLEVLAPRAAGSSAWEEPGRVINWVAPPLGRGGRFASQGHLPPAARMLPWVTIRKLPPTWGPEGLVKAKGRGSPVHRGQRGGEGLEPAMPTLWPGSRSADLWDAA